MRAVAFLMLLCPAIAMAEGIQCPAVLNVAPQTLGQPYNEWRPFIDKVNTRYPLRAVSLYSGAPEELASLVPDMNTAEYAEWKLAGNGKENYFITCAYDNTSLQLTRSLPSTFTRCRVTYEQNMSTPRGTPVPLHVKCY